jgi:hypothetical protein
MWLKEFLTHVVLLPGENNTHLKHSFSHIDGSPFFGPSQIPSFIVLRPDICFALVLKLVLFWMGHHGTMGPK